MRRLSHAMALAALLAHPAQAATEARSVAGFDEVVLMVPGELGIEQGLQESLTVEAEPAVLRKITTEVRGRQLLIATVPGSIETRQPIRFRLGVKALRGLDARAPATVTIGPLRSNSLALAMAGAGGIRLERLEDARSLDVRINGSGEVAIGGGQVAAQRLAIAGAGSYAAPTLASEQAEVAIHGSGQARLAASRTLAVRIDGVGNVRYRGDPAVARTIHGVGSVEKED